MVDAQENSHGISPEDPPSGPIQVDIQPTVTTLDVQPADAAGTGVDDAGRTGELWGEVAALRLEVASQKQRADEAGAQAYRTLADFDNYRKRTERDRADQVKFASERLLKEMLPLLDNLDRALSHAKDARDFDKIIEGVDLIQKQQLATLEKFGVRAIEATGQPFDPTCHQSIGQTETERPEEESRVINEVQKGYMLHDRVLRPSLVTVGVRKVEAG